MNLDLSKVKTYSIKKRFSKINKSLFAKVCGKKSGFGEFYASLPDILKAKDFKAVVEAIVAAKKKKQAGDSYDGSACD